MNSILSVIKRVLVPQSISREAVEAYFYRLPEVVTVKWMRDEDMIVGYVDDGTHKFVTQGTSVDDFIEMVNVSIMTVNNIPDNYFTVMKSFKTYKPTAAEELSLRNGKVHSAVISAHKDKKVLQVA